MSRLIRLKKLLSEAELDKENNALYIDDLKESIAFEEKRSPTAYEVASGQYSFGTMSNSET